MKTKSPSKPKRRSTLSKRRQPATSVQGDLARAMFAQWKKNNHDPKPKGGPVEKLNPKAQAWMDTVDLWAAEDPDYDAAVWPKIKARIEQNRLSSRKRFHA